MVRGAILCDSCGTVIPKHFPEDYNDHIIINTPDKRELKVPVDIHINRVETDLCATCTFRGILALVERKFG